MQETAKRALPDDLFAHGIDACYVTFL